MKDLLSTVLVFGLLFVLIGVVWFVLARLGLLRPQGAARERVAPEPESAVFPYATRRQVLSDGERAFLPVLHEAAAALATSRQLPVPLVLPSVRLAEILAVDSGRAANASVRTSAQNRINGKQADFVLCDPKTTRPLLIVELDDRSHERQDRKERDRFLDQACGAAGMPVLHVIAASAYNPAKIAQQMESALQTARV